MGQSPFYNYAMDIAEHLKGKAKERKEAKHLKPALEPVNENMRNDTMELEGIMSNFGEEDEDENDLPISPGYAR